jgi:hypothetical protein
VAAIALFSQFSIVSVVVFVAANTFLRRLAVLLFWFVAIRTFNLAVCAIQLEVCSAMVEIFPIQSNDIEIPTLMFGMAGFASPTVDARYPSMKACAATYVLRHLFMAVQAKLVLQPLAERLVAFFTFLLVLRVSLNQISRHYQCFQRLYRTRPGQRGTDRQENGDQEGPLNR